MHQVLSNKERGVPCST